MNRIKTTRFGEVEIDEAKVVHFHEGMIGFPDHRNFVLLEHKPGSPFMWLQSTEDPDLAFVLTNPFIMKSDYLEDLPHEERRRVLGENGKSPLVLAVVTIPPGDAHRATVNLLGPLVIDIESRTGRQVILAGSDYHTRHPLS
ncbi:MAG: flagellar assembly protein FliW [Desulfobacteraceae bacterium]